MKSVVIPFYRVDNNLFIDAYFMDKLTRSYERILLIRRDVVLENTRIEKLLEPIPIPKVKELLEEGYNDLNNMARNRRNIDGTDVILSIFYNPSYYLRKQEKEITFSSILRIYELAYKTVLSKLSNNKNIQLIYSKILFVNSINFNDKEDVVYNYLFNTDDRFKDAILSVLSEQ